MTYAHQARVEGLQIDNDDLKACPHCGGKAYLYNNYSYKIKRYFVCVKCEACGATGRTHVSKDDPEAYGWELPAAQLAAGAWNMRTHADVEPMTTAKAIRYLQLEDPEMWDEITHGEIY